MEFDHYQALALRTANPDLDPRERLCNAALGLAGEAGEAADLLKKHLFHNHPLDRAKLQKELGDVLWYLAALAHAADLTLDEIASHNLDKLRARYPEGFDAARSQQRPPDEG